jgi:hypothetical protein
MSMASYVDDIIVISKEPMEAVNRLKQKYILKGIGRNERGITTALSAITYIRNSVEKFERMFEGPLKESKFPMIEGAHSEFDTSNLQQKWHQYIAQLLDRCIGQ